MTTYGFFWSTHGDAVFGFFVPFFFFFCLISVFFNTIFPFDPFFFILTAEPAGHALGSIMIYFELLGKIVLKKKRPNRKKTGTK